MPTIKQLPAATSVAATDLLPLSQGGTTKSLSIGSLLSSVQPALSLSQSKLLGRVSATAGGPEPVNVGSGLTIAAGSLVATGADHLQLPVSPGLQVGDEVIVNSGGAARRLQAASLRDLFSAGPGVSIDGSGSISAPAVAGAITQDSLPAAPILSTDGTVARSLAARAADFVWLQDYGAVDPTGALDCTAAFRAAIATGRHVRVPDGTLKIRQTLTLAAGQGLIGSDRGTSVLLVGPDFSSSATAIIAGPGAGAGPILRHIGFSFAQPSTVTSRAAFRTLAQANGSGAVGIKYPPAIDFSGLPRFILDNIRISGAWDGIKALGNCGGAWLRQIEIGALNVGLQMDGSQDFVHIHGYHFWPFGLTGGTTFTSVYLDGNTFAWQLGEVDGLNASDVNTYGGRLVITSNANNGPPQTITGLNLDAQFGTLEVAGGTVSVSNVYTTKNSVETAAAILVTGGTITMSSVYFWGDPAAPLVSVSGGSCVIDGGHVIQNAVSQPAISLSGGTLLLRALHMQPGAGHNYPYVVQTGGVIDIQGCKWDTAGNSAVSIGVDSVGNIVAGNDTGGAAIALPGGTLLGTYGPNFPMAHGNFAITDMANSSSVFFRIQGTQLQFVSSDYSKVILGLSQNGDLSTASSVSSSTFNIQGNGSTQYRLAGGSNFSWNAYDAIGAFAGSVLSISNATQVVTFGQSPLVPTPVQGNNSTQVATTAFVAAALGASAATVGAKTVDGTVVPGSTATPYQMQVADRRIWVRKATGAATAILLPTSPTVNVEYIIKDKKGDAGTNAITISGGTIDGASRYVMSSAYESATLMFDGTDWGVV